MPKFIQLFEEYTKSTKEGDSSKLTWADVRDSIQMKRPFVIVVFKDEESYLAAAKEELAPYLKLPQTAIMIRDGAKRNYPSLFFVLDQDESFTTDIKNLYEKYDIVQVVIGKANSSQATLYSEDGSSSDFGNEIITTLSPDEMATNDHFKVGSNYYKFINQVA